MGLPPMALQRKHLFVCLVILALFGSLAEAQLPDFPTEWYEYLDTSFFTSFSIEGGNYTFSTQVSTLSTVDELTNSVTTFYWTTFYRSFTGYWGDDYDSNVVIYEEREEENSDSGATQLFTPLAFYLSTILATVFVLV